MIYELAHHMALLPWLALAWRRPRESAVYWLAGVFLVAWLADWGAHGLPPFLVGAVYPLSQAGLVAAVLAPRDRAWMIVAALTMLAIGLAPWWGNAPELVFRTAAWGTIVALLWFRGPLAGLREPLLCYFGVGLLTWYTFAAGWPNSWLAYQGVRLAGLGWFGAVVLWPPRFITLTARDGTL